MTELSPAAQAVLDAYCTEADLRNREVTDHEMLAAALRAAADQVIPMTESPWGSVLVPVLSAEESKKKLLAIAAELEAQ